MLLFLRMYLIRNDKILDFIETHTGKSLTVDPGADVKVGDTWNFFIDISVRGGQGE